MDNPSDEAIAEALRSAHLCDDPLEIQRCRDNVHDCAQSILAHARTIDQRNKLVDALEFYDCGDGTECDCPQGTDNRDSKWCGFYARQALTQFRSGQ